MNLDQDPRVADVSQQISWSILKVSCTCSKQFLHFIVKQNQCNKLLFAHTYIHTHIHTHAYIYISLIWKRSKDLVRGLTRVFLQPLDMQAEPAAMVTLLVPVLSSQVVMSSWVCFLTFGGWPFKIVWKKQTLNYRDYHSTQT